LEQLVGFHDDAIILVVVAHAQGSHDPGGLGEVEEVHLSRHLALGRAQFGDEAGEVVPERLDLALLALEGDGGATLPRLQVEDALSGIADGPRREEVRLLEVEGLAHLTPTCARSPSMEFTVRAALLDRLYASALIDAVPMTMRWKRSGAVPMGWATAALMGSACDTATTILPVWRATMRARAPVTRACISVNDSPPGKRKPLGCCCTARHSALAAASLRDRPVHLPMSTSSRPRSMRTAMFRALAMMPAVPRARSSREDEMATTFSVLAMRAAAASACLRPCSERWRPRARPGSFTPVVGVRPWRTRRTMVEGGGFLSFIARSGMPSHPALAGSPRSFSLPDGEGWGDGDSTTSDPTHGAARPASPARCAEAWRAPRAAPHRNRRAHPRWRSRWPPRPGWRRSLPRP